MHKSEAQERTGFSDGVRCSQLISKAEDIAIGILFVESQSRFGIYILPEERNQLLKRAAMLSKEADKISEQYKQYNRVAQERLRQLQEAILKCDTASWSLKYIHRN